MVLTAKYLNNNAISRQYEIQVKYSFNTPWYVHYLRRNNDKYGNDTGTCQILSIIWQRIEDKINLNWSTWRCTLGQILNAMEYQGQA